MSGGFIFLIMDNNLNTIQNTVHDLATLINKTSIASGNGVAITECTSFTDYPEILKNVINAATSSAITLLIYKVSDINPGIPQDSGSFNFNTYVFTPPSGWFKADTIQIKDTDTVWMSQAIFAKTDISNSGIVGSWSLPIKITEPFIHTESDRIQSVYLNTNSNDVPYKPSASYDESLNSDSIERGWSENYIGLNSDKPYVWVSSRKNTSGEWSNYTTPVLYSYYSKDGKDGKSVSSDRTVFAFKSTSSRTQAPDKPHGGKWDVNSNNIILPEGWHESPSVDSVNKYSWMSIAIFTTNTSNPVWSDPTCITGEDGVAGTDGLNSEFIYALIPNQSDLNEFKNYFNRIGASLEVSGTDVIPNFIIPNENPSTSLTVVRQDGTKFTVNLTDSPVGIDGTANKAEISWTRTKGDEGWNMWIGPMFWSVWGENGMNGDGIEYIYTASDNETCDAVLPVYADLLLNNPEEAIKFQEHEYVPTGWYDNDDDWGGIGPDTPYLFCSSRKQYTDDTGKQMWGDFSTPKLWGHWGKDGLGSYTSFAFCISKEDLSKYTVTGGSYSNPIENVITHKNDEIIDITWHDAVPNNPNYDESIWMINKFFKGAPEEDLSDWFGPVKMADSEHFQVEFNCPEENNSRSEYDGRSLISFEDFKNMKAAETPPVIYQSITDLETAWRQYVYNNNCGKWTDGGSGAVYMATARCVNNKWEEWTINKIKGESGDATQFVYRITDGSMPDNPTPVNTSGDFQNNSYKPSGWSLNPQSVTESNPICWISQRRKTNGKWGSYSNPVEWSIYAKGAVHLELTQDQVNVPCDPNGYIDSDYKFIVVDLMLYDNQQNVYGTYTANVNGGSWDFQISTVLLEEPTDSMTCGFYGSKLYIGTEYLNKYSLDESLTVDCQVRYKGSLYTKTFEINKTTNTYELELSNNVLSVYNTGLFKENELKVSVSKWVQDRFMPVSSGYIEIYVTQDDDSMASYGSELTDNTMSIWLQNYTNVKSMQVNYRTDATSPILAYEIIGTVRDGNKGEDGKDGEDGAFGPMARYSIWGNNEPDVYYDRDSAALLPNPSWYDIVEYENDYYLCVRQHSSIGSPTPGTDSGTWLKSSHYDFITAKKGAIQDLVAGNVVADRLETSNPDGSRISISEGLMIAKGTGNYSKASITIGVTEEGEPVLYIYSSDGSLIWKMDKDGFNSVSSSDHVTRFDPYSYKHRLSDDIYDEKGYYSSEFMKQVTSNTINWGSPTSSKIYSLYDVTTVDGNKSYGENHGMYYNDGYENSGKATGTYLSFRYSLGSSSELADQSVLTEFNSRVDSSYIIDQPNKPLYYCTFMRVVNGEVESTDKGTLFWYA